MRFFCENKDISPFSINTLQVQAYKPMYAEKVKIATPKVI